MTSARSNVRSVKLHCDWWYGGTRRCSKKGASLGNASEHNGRSSIRPDRMSCTNTAQSLQFIEVYICVRLAVLIGSRAFAMPPYRFPTQRRPPPARRAFGTETFLVQVNLARGSRGFANCEARNAFFIASRRLPCRRNPRGRSPDRDRCVHRHRVDLRALIAAPQRRRHAEQGGVRPPQRKRPQRNAEAVLLRA